jgi:IgA Peptidase M64
MATSPLKWIEGEGYDIHVLRTPQNLPQLPSKPLDASFEIDSQFAQFPLTFIPHFKGNQGVNVVPATGVVTASPPPDPANKLRNFLMTARQDVGGGDIFENIIRIHLHESIQKIWLTPSSLTVHARDSDCRFTVLALFDDGTVGDITDWPKIMKLTYSSALTVIVDVLNAGDPRHGGDDVELIGGRLLVKSNGEPVDHVDITVTLELPPPLIPASAPNLTATAKVLPRPSWSDVAGDPKTKVTWVAGPQRPNENVLPSKPEHPINVIKSRPNILFVSEGFGAKKSALIDPPKDFDKAVKSTVNAWLSVEENQPFKLLKDSINYWSLYLPSTENGISLLGDFPTNGGSRVPLLPEEPPPSSTSWSLENMIHQLGVPVPNDPVQSIPDAITRWNKLYVTQVPVTEKLVKGSFSDWNDLRSRSPLNELDTAFGFGIETRTRASLVKPWGDPLLRPAPRRTSEATINTDFISNLKISGFPVDGNWAAKDRGLVCFICLSDVGAGEASSGYFAASTGYDFRASVVVIANVDGSNIKTALLSDPKAPYDPDVFAERAAHECGHAFGLADEYGPGNGTMLTAAPTSVPNLQAKSAITSTSSSNTTVYHPDRIKWLWPRAIKVGLMTGVSALGVGSFQMNMAPGQGKLFAKDDLVLIRRPPLTDDPFIDFRFKVVQPHPDWVEVIQTKGTLDLNVTPYDATKLHVLICASKPTNPGVELKLIADPILNRISSGPLTELVCNPTANAAVAMTPVNMPKLKFNSKPPPTPADIIGIYEGGGHLDCGIFRPAGRCKMRTQVDWSSPRSKIIPFCQVCRYLIVDRVNAMKLAELDAKQYDPNYPS